ncbi:TolC family protein [Bacteroides sp. 224]|uniref:TolC family protein n=1 Tax=Bacteroides sp. 224 TaxID=2302936 RepID=UPI0013D1EB58|nr:TolC family protein [Bacteroides sp. 224]NDV65519.1 TolC family protein [Bacteroides sp. 224]
MKNKILFNVSVVSLIFSLSASLHAQTKTLTLLKSIEIACDSSLQAFSSKNLYLARYWEYRTFKAGRLPSLTLNTNPLQYSREIIKEYDSKDNMNFYRNQQELSSSAQLSISQNVDLTGGTVYLESSLGFLRTYGAETKNQYTTVPVRLRYSQSLFGFNSFKWEKRLEPLKFEKAKRQFLYTKEEISETVIRYFFNLAMAQKEYDLALEYVASADTLYRIGMERQKIVAISQADLLTLELDAVNARNSLQNSEMSLKRAMFSLASYLNMDEDTHITLQLPERPGTLTITADEALRYAQENNPDYLSYKQELLTAEREVEYTRKNSNFSASLSASVGFNQFGNTLSRAYQDFSQQNVFGLSLSIPLVDWGIRKGKANMARNNLNVTKLSIQQQYVKLEQDITMTVGDFNTQQNLIASAERAMKLADQAYNVTKQRFIIGKADLNSLTLSQNRQNTAQKNYIYALSNYWQNYYKLRKLTLFDFEKNKTLSFMFDALMNIR